ncbi:hypothetical protein N7448_002786 [Penicillium atrosanguineum]|uniref:Uncharacterized protein n=1 Tax=Penicillium atrosanguineum TaxID=1132637 RepID=A0A9W9HE85_9EURO|nr:uncharacterized protein N7443_006191 [Penicillium atrosanguineum]KAJ5129075.1 hypothetical protein N7526_007241 [Penicillium atrosanguineum]KAJ5145394.1 hypothetical protein N7448_002786 [Penicillium atrosanguineum]KAJ5301189.1 hypothetical protein N7443_006191 [Penicillium atrosanguineum]KAJ5311832.1 hypothetical protein N7476_007692 [Penicillium atrosanguineum]
MTAAEICGWMEEKSLRNTRFERQVTCDMLSLIASLILQMMNILRVAQAAQGTSRGRTGDTTF